MAVTQLGYIGVGVSNMDAWEAYLQEVLGMEVVERAKAIRPNSSGIRVCIRREASARAGAWGELVKQLKANGVDGDQIDWGNDQVP